MLGNQLKGWTNNIVQSFLRILCKIEKVYEYKIIWNDSDLLKNSQVKINSKLNEKNRMITY